MQETFLTPVFTQSQVLFIVFDLKAILFILGVFLFKFFFEHFFEDW